jgi:hypothetical protein
MVDQPFLHSELVAVLEMRLETESKPLPADRRTVVISPTLEYRVLQAAIRPVEAKVRQEVAKLQFTLVLTFPHPVAVVDDVAQYGYTPGAANDVAAKWFGPTDRGDPIHLVNGRPIPLVAILVFQGIVVGVGRNEKRHVRGRSARGGRQKEKQTCQSAGIATDRGMQSSRSHF